MTKMTFKILHLNIRSLVPKFSTLKDFVNEHSYDVIALSETWLTSNFSDHLLQLPDYIMYRDDKGRGNGLCLYIKNIYKARPPVNNISVEPNATQILITIQFKQFTLGVGVGYRTHGTGYKVFCGELEQLLTHLSNKCNKLVFIRNINIDFIKTRYEILLRNATKSWF